MNSAMSVAARSSPRMAQARLLTFVRVVTAALACR